MTRVSPEYRDARRAHIIEAAHARLTAQIWGEAAVRPELAETVRTRHAALRDHLTTLIQLGRPGHRVTLRLASPYMNNCAR